MLTTTPLVLFTIPGQKRSALRQGFSRIPRAQVRHAALRLLGRSDPRAPRAVSECIRRAAITWSAMRSKPTPRSPSSSFSPTTAQASTSSPAANLSACSPRLPKLSTASSSPASAKRPQRSTRLCAPAYCSSTSKAKPELELLAARARKLKTQSPLRSARQSRRLRRNASLHLDRPARAQVRHRHSPRPRASTSAPPAIAGSSRTASASTSARRSAPPIPSAQHWSASASSCANSTAPASNPAPSMPAAVSASTTTAPSVRSRRQSSRIRRRTRSRPRRFHGPSAARARPLPRRPGRRAGHARACTSSAMAQKTFVITDAAMNDLIRPALYQAHHEIVPVRPRHGKARPGRCRRPGLRNRRLLRPRPRAQACQARRSHRAARRRRLRHGAELQLQHAPARRRSPGRGPQGAPHPPPRNNRRSPCTRRSILAKSCKSCLTCSRASLQLAHFRHPS